MEEKTSKTQDTSQQVVDVNKLQENNSEKTIDCLSSDSFTTKLKEKLPKKRPRNTDTITLCKVIFLCVSCFLSFVLLSISTGLDSWSIVTDDLSGFKILNNGLWRVCFYTAQMNTCEDIGDYVDLPDWWVVCRAFAVLACILSMVAFLISCLCVYSENIHPKIVCFLTIPFIILMIVVLSAYADHIKKSEILQTLQEGPVKYGVGFIVGWLGIVFSVGNAIYAMHF